MNRKLAVAVVALVVGLLPVVGMCASDVKVGVVDMSRLLKAHPDTPAAESSLQKQADEYESEQKDLKTKLEKMQKEVEAAIEEAQNKALSDTAKETTKKTAEEKLAALRESEKKFRDTFMQRQKELNEQRRRLEKKIIGKIKDAVKKYADKNGYTVVLDSSSIGVTGVEPVVYSTEKLDITDDVLKTMSKEKSE